MISFHLSIRFEYIICFNISRPLFCWLSQYFISGEISLLFRDLGCVLLLVSLKNTSKVFDWIQARRDIFPGQSSYLQSSLTVSVCFESLSCWNILLLPELWRLETILSDSILVYPQTFTPPSVNVIYPTPFALKQPMSLQTYRCASLLWLFFTIVVLTKFMPKILDKCILVSVCSQCILSTHQASFYFLENINPLVLCQRTWVSFLNAIPSVWLYPRSMELSQKVHWYPLITYMRSLQRSPSVFHN